MKKNNFAYILIASFLGAFLRFYISNNFLILILGSFFLGFVSARRYSKEINSVLLFGFCSCFTSFSGFIYFLHKIIQQGEFLKSLFYLNILIILNLIMMNLGMKASRKIT